MKEAISMLATVVVISSCGGTSSSSESDNGVANKLSFAVDSAAALPTCDLARAGALAYVTAEKKFYTCEDSWVAIEIKGEKGDKGETGAAGAQGVKGDVGASGTTVTSTRECSKIVTQTYFNYRVLTFSSGDKITTCSISNTDSSYSRTHFYRSTQNGAVEEYCSVIYDLDSGSGGFWQFVKTAGGATATYSDNVSPSDGEVVTFSASDCTFN